MKNKTSYITHLFAITAFAVVATGLFLRESKSELKTSTNATHDHEIQKLSLDQTPDAPRAPQKATEHRIYAPDHDLKPLNEILKKSDTMEAMRRSGRISPMRYLDMQLELINETLKTLNSFDSRQK